ncbi:MAG: hypothetical protein R2865_02150 [Deinococcales bacterium]
MPIYVYKNLDTGETFEYQQSISEAALKTHPETGCARHPPYSACWHCL